MVKFKLPALPRKKKGGAPPDIESEAEDGAGKEADAAQEKDDVPAEAGQMRFVADMERLKAQVEALNQTKDSWSQRFSDVSERIGELRTMLTEAESKMAGIEVKSTKAADLVEELDPEKIIGEMQRRDAQYEALKAKLESSQSIYDSIIIDLKDIRSRIGMFRGVEGLLKLSDEVKDELIAIQKIKAVTEAHADKVESIFMDFRENIKEFAKISNAVKESQASISEIRKLADAHDGQIKFLAPRKDLEQLSAKVDAVSEKLGKYTETINKASFESDQFLGIVEGNSRAIEELKQNQALIQNYMENRGAPGGKGLEETVQRNSQRIEEILEVLELLAGKNSKNKRRGGAEADAAEEPPAKAPAGNEYKKRAGPEGRKAPRTRRKP